MTQHQLQTEINSIKEQLVKKYKPEKIILFGSAARGETTPDSDLDFLIIKRVRDDPYERMVKVYGLVDKNMAADFLIYTPREFRERLELGDPFIKTILEEGRVLYG